MSIEQQQSNIKPTDVSDFIANLRGGVFEQKIANALSEVGLGVIANGKQGSVTLTFTMKQIGESRQIATQHKIAFTAPTKNGKQSFEDTTDTPLYVNIGGNITAFPEEQGQLFPTKTSKPITQE